MSTSRTEDNNAMNDDIPTDNQSFEPTLLNSTSSFEEVTQYLAEKYLLKPYPNHDGNKIPIPDVFRYGHGALHASCSVYASELVIAFIKEYLPDYSGLKDYFADPELELLFRYGVFCHDIGNTQESDPCTESHARIYTKEMLALGFDSNKVTIIANVMRNKDTLREKSIFEMALHDGDSLEFNRYLNEFKSFDITKLDIYKLCSQYLPEAKEARSEWYIELVGICEYYHTLTVFLQKNHEIHKQCELAQNVFLKAGQYIQAIRLWCEIQSELIHKKLFTPNLIEFINLPNFNIPPLERFNVSHHLSCLSILEKIFTLPEEESQKDEVLKKFSEEYLYIRRLTRNVNKTYPIDDEVYILNQNEKILKEANVTTAEMLKERVNNQSLKNLFIRPSTCIAEEFAVNCYDTDAAGVILDPDKVMASHFYKENVESNKLLGKEKYLFDRPEGVKSLPSAQVLVNKLRERENRRKGIEPDNFNKYYGKLYTTRNEVWLNYHFDAVMGILIGKTQASALNALQLRRKIYLSKGKVLSFYTYSCVEGLTKIPQLEVLAKAKLIINIAIKQPTQFHKDLKSYNIIYNPQIASCLYNGIVSFESICCSLASGIPSPETPIKFKMIAVIKLYINQSTGQFSPGINPWGESGKQKMIPVVATAGFINRYPVISLYNPFTQATENYLDVNSKLSELMKTHLHNKARQCDMIIGKLTWNIMQTYRLSINELNIYDRNINKSQPSKAKSVLSLSLNHEEGFDASQFILTEFLKDIFDYVDPVKSGDIFSRSTGLQIRLRNVHSIEAMYHRLQILLSQVEVGLHTPQEQKLTTIQPKNKFDLLMTKIYFMTEQASKEQNSWLLQNCKSKFENLWEYLNDDPSPNAKINMTIYQSRFNTLIMTLNNLGKLPLFIDDILAAGRNAKIEYDVLSPAVAGLFVINREDVVEKLLKYSGYTSKEAQLGELIYHLCTNTMTEDISFILEKRNHSIDSTPEKMGTIFTWLLENIAFAEDHEDRIPSDDLDYDNMSSILDRYDGTIKFIPGDSVYKFITILLRDGHINLLKRVILRLDRIEISPDEMSKLLCSLLGVHYDIIISILHRYKGTIKFPLERTLEDITLTLITDNQFFILDKISPFLKGINIDIDKYRSVFDALDHKETADGSSFIHFAAKIKNAKLLTILLHDFNIGILDYFEMRPLDYWLSPGYRTENSLNKFEELLKLIQEEYVINNEHLELFGCIVKYHYEDMPSRILVDLLNLLYPHFGNFSFLQPSKVDDVDSEYDCNLSRFLLAEVLFYVILGSLSYPDDVIFQRVAINIINDKHFKVTKDDLVNPNNTHYWGSTLHFLLVHPNPSLDIFNLLIRAGENVDFLDSAGNSPRDLAKILADKGKPEFIQAIKSYKTSSRLVNTSNSDISLFQRDAKGVFKRKALSNLDLENKDDAEDKSIVESKSLAKKITIETNNNSMVDDKAEVERIIEMGDNTETYVPNKKLAIGSKSFSLKTSQTFFHSAKTISLPSPSQILMDLGNTS